MSEDTALSPIEIAAELTAAWLSNPNTRATADDALTFFNTMKGAADVAPVAVEEEPASAAPEYAPATTVRKSLASGEHIISMIDGKSYRTLTRHLSTHGLTPDEYRARYNLKSDYPMTAPAYSKARSEMAKKLGLGRKPGMTKATVAEPAEPVASKRRTRTPKAE